MAKFRPPGGWKMPGIFGFPSLSAYMQPIWWWCWAPFPGQKVKFTGCRDSQFLDGISHNFTCRQFNVCTFCLDIMENVHLEYIFSSLTTSIDNNWVCYTKKGSLLSIHGNLLGHGRIMLHWLLWLMLTHCGQVTLYGDMEPGQHWVRKWLVAWWHLGSHYLNQCWLIINKVLCH